MRYGVALTLSAAALGISLLLHGLVAPVPFIFFFPAMFLASWYGGFGPGIVPALTGTAMASIVFMPRSGGLPSYSAGDIGRLALFVGLSVMISYFGKLMREARSAADARAEEAKALARQLDERNAELEAQAVEMQESAQQLEELNLEQEQMVLELRERTGEAEAAREAAVEASRAKSQFLAVMSHELRTPLNAILGYSDLLESGISGSLTDDQLLYLTRIRISVGHLRDLIDQVLSLARIEAGKEDVWPERVDVAALARDAAMLVQPAASEKGLRLVTELPPTLEAVTDTQKLRQILLNLLSNAVKFTEQGCVALRLRVLPSALRGGDAGSDFFALEVEDTGVGITAEDLDRIFEPFTQADQSTTRRVGGTGLGLAVSRRLAHLLGGSITVSSTPGKGSTFTVSMPIDGIGDVTAEDVRAGKLQVAGRLD
jgi:signal transduction histidine kinase